MKSLLEQLNKLKSSFLALPMSHKILYGGSLLVLIGALSFLAYTVNKTEYAPLYGRLSEEDMGGVAEALKAKKIPYHLSGANSISVPKEQLYEVRLALASEGVPKGSGVGFEVFDQQKLGSTEFVQKINYQRALQGELSRTINGMKEVMESRVHLVIPSESLFAEDQKNPSAAVVLKLRPGAKLEQQQIQGIVNLVSSAVQGLTDDKVTVMSTDGQVLFKKNPMENSFQMTNLQLQLKNNVEDEVRRKVQTIIEQVVGANRAIARVTADLDFSQMQVNEDIYDPDSSVVRSQQRSTENVQGGEAATKGNPDAPINVESQLMQTPSAQGQQSQKVSNRQRETVNYEINHINRQTKHSPGGIKKLSVAVIVDGPYEMKPDKSGKPMPVFVGRTPDQLKALEDIVKKTVGFNETRGDQITVSNVAFATDLVGPETGQVENYWVKMLKDNQKILWNLLLTVLVFFFIIRPFMRKFKKMGETPKELPEVEAPPALPDATAGRAGHPGSEGTEEEQEMTLRQKTAQLIKENPEQATMIIRSLLREEI